MLCMPYRLPRSETSVNVHFWNVQEAEHLCVFAYENVQIKALFRLRGSLQNKKKSFDFIFYGTIKLILTNTCLVY